MSDFVYLNGKIIPKHEARILPDDRGFNFADGVYEVIKYYGGKPFRMADHITRLNRSLNEINIHFEGVDQLELIFWKLLNKNGIEQQDAGVYLQVSRGAYPRVHRFPEHSTPTVYATVFPFASKTGQLKNGVKVILTEDIRWLRCDIKSISLLPNVMAAQKAYEQQAEEAIFFRNGIITEGSHSSFMAVKNGIVYTHPDSNLILPGITKKVVFEICKSQQVKLVEESIPVSELANMDEIMIVGTGSEVCPVVQVGEIWVGNGKPGPVTKIIQEKFFERVGALI